MRLKVKNYKGIQSAEIEIDRIALVSGPNGAGKSSIVQGCRAVLTGDPVPELAPHTKLTKDQYASLVRDGQSGGSVILEDPEAGKDGVSQMMAFPDGKLATVGGRGLQISATAAGRWDAQLPNLKPSDRAALLVSMLAAVPTQEMLGEFFHENGIKQAAITSKVWSIIDSKGWDGAFSQAEDTGRQLKGQWTEASGGDTWGIDKGENWRPATWRADLDHVSAETAANMLAKLKESHQAVIGSAAVGADKRKQISAAADVEPVRKTALTNARSAEATAVRALATAKQAHQDELAERPALAMKCPHCGGLVAINTETHKLDAAEVGADHDAFVAMTGKINKKHEALIGAADNVRVTQHSATVAAETAYKESTDAVEAMKTMKDAPSPTHEVDLRDSLAALQSAQSDFNMTSQVARCAAIHARLRINHVIKQALAPSGLRAAAIAAKLLAFNTEMDALADAMGAPQVTIAQDMSITVDKRPYRDISDSEQFRTRIIMQVATALRQETPFVLIDNEVDMDSVWYGRLIKMLLGAKVFAIVAIRSNRIVDAINPQNPKAPAAFQQLVRNYWLDDGVATQVKPPTVAAA